MFTGIKNMVSTVVIFLKVAGRFESTVLCVVWFGCQLGQLIYQLRHGARGQGNMCRKMSLKAHEDVTFTGGKPNFPKFISSS